MSDHPRFTFWAAPSDDTGIILVHCEGALGLVELHTCFVVSTTQAAADHFPSTLIAICDELRTRIMHALGDAPLTLTERVA